MTRLWRRRGMNEMRRITELFVDDSPSTIRLVPHKKVSRPGGTYEFVPQKARKPQTFRLVPFGVNMNDGIQNLEGADISKWTYHLIGDYDCEMEIGDTWIWRGIQYRILAILPQNNWERRALVTIFGQAPPENLPSREIAQPPWVERADQRLGPRPYRPPIVTDPSELEEGEAAYGGD